MERYEQDQIQAIGEDWVALGNGLPLALVRDLNERALTLLKKDLDIVVHESKEKTEETGLETVELSNEGKSAWFNLKDTAILLVIHLHKIKGVLMVGFTPGVVPGSLRSEVVLYQCAEYPEPLKI